MGKILIDHYIKELKNTLEGDNWVGETFRKKIDSLNEEEVFVRPIPEMHSVAELVSHVVVWKWEVFSRLNGNTRKLSMESPENWKTNDELKAIGWKRLKSDLYGIQLETINFLNEKEDSFLIDNEYENGCSFEYLVEGLVQHDMYHLGQLGIVIKLVKK